MTVTYGGEVEIAAAIPGAVAALNLAIPNLQAQLDALLAFSPGAISFQADLDMALGMVAAIRGAIAIGIQPPSLQAQIDIIFGLLASLQANLAAIAAFQALLSARLFAYGYEGPTNQFGTELQAELSGGYPGRPATEQTHAIVLGAATNASYTAMLGVFMGF